MMPGGDCLWRCQRYGNGHYRECWRGHGSLAIFFHALQEIGLSLLLGATIGVLIHWITKKLNNSGEILIITLGLILLSIAMSNVFHLSPLLTNMTAGAFLINLSSRNHRLFRILQPLTPPSTPSFLSWPEQN
jgi:NhaP-type Na+/H+ and K+/H+ antiporter